jgi:uncharacterized iron-regulated protein/Tfp pilus assembly protein PilO
LSIAEPRQFSGIADQPAAPVKEWPMLHSASPLALILFVILTILAFADNSALATGDRPIEYDLAVSFSPEQHRLSGTAGISLAPGSGIELDLQGLTISGLLLRNEDGREYSPSTPQQGRLTLPPDVKRRMLYISYTKEVGATSDDRIDGNGIVLTGLWHPQPQQRMRFRLTAELPDGFTAVSESDHFPLMREGKKVIATFSQPVHNLHLAAAPYSEDSVEVRPGLRVYSLFFPEDRDLAASYLEAAAGYLQRYEKEIGPFPYAHYVIAANRLPTGLGLPTFTLLGQQVLRLPFIRKTSLGHEILHSWFGNSVEADLAEGNWCEGLTSFLADHAYRADQGQAAVDRKERIVNYLSYVTEKTGIPLSAFHAADHRQAAANAMRAVGYNRGLLLFSELQELLGRAIFNRAVQTLYQEYRGKNASWHDLKRIFSQTAKRNLDLFFKERLERTDIPELAVDHLEVGWKNGQTLLNFDLLQKTKQPFSLQVPLTVATSGGVQDFVVSSDKQSTPVSLTINGSPLQLTVDPDSSFLRKLTAPELPAVWSRFLGAEKKLAIVESAEAKETYKPLLDRLADDSWTIKTADEVKAAELAEKSLLFLGLQHPLSRSLFARPDHPAVGFTLDVRRHPLNPELVAVLVSSAGREETAAAAGKLRHYGGYSRLHFAGGRMTKQETEESETGLQYTLEQLPAGAATSSLHPFATVIAELADTRVIHIGETHTAMADHRLQLQIIEALYRQNPDLAIGMEMFPATSQAALDLYTGGKGGIDERNFLKSSRYFQVWRYDYRYYREIINFACARKIPVIGLNLDNETVRTIAKTGSLDSLPEDIRRSLPVDRDLDMPGYADELAAMHDMHAAAGHGGGSFAGFIQAQALWDETMAENLAKYLAEHPQRRMVVLAGSQHSRKDQGIPPRLGRRIPVTQATVFNIAGDNPANQLTQMADYFFVSPAENLPEAAMMGIVLESQKSANGPALRISGFTPDSKADEAGLQKDDALLTLDGFPIENMDDVRIALLDARPGEKIEVTVERGGQKGAEKKELRVSVALIRPAAEAVHP